MNGHKFHYTHFSRVSAISLHARVIKTTSKRRVVGRDIPSRVIPERDGDNEIKA